MMAQAIKTRRKMIEVEPVNIELGSFTPGASVWMPENSVDTEFLVAHHDMPSLIYDVSFDGGTWLLRKDVLPNRQWHTSNVNDYANSAIHSWLNNDYFNTIAQNARNIIKQVRIPYRAGSGTSNSVSSGANGLLCRVFLLSLVEAGGETVATVPADGATLSYFSGIGSNNANVRRVAYRSGSAAAWWVRSPNTFNGSANVWYVNTDGRLVNSTASASTIAGSRPAFVLPSSTLVTADGKLIL